MYNIIVARVAPESLKAYQIATNNIIGALKGKV